jgi:hypothetical protein
MSANCPNCGFKIGKQLGGKLGLGLAAALVGSRINPAVGLLAGIIGAAIGHRYIDAAIYKCPTCGGVFRLAESFL